MLGNQAMGGMQGPGELFSGLLGNQPLMMGLGLLSGQNPMQALMMQMMMGGRRNTTPAPFGNPYGGPPTPDGATLGIWNSGLPWQRWGGPM